MFQFLLGILFFDLLFIAWQSRKSNTYYYLYYSIRNTCNHKGSKSAEGEIEIIYLYTNFLRVQNFVYC